MSPNLGAPPLNPPPQNPATFGQMGGCPTGANRLPRLAEAIKSRLAMIGIPTCALFLARRVNFETYFSTNLPILDFTARFYQIEDALSKIM